MDNKCSRCGGNHFNLECMYFNIKNKSNTKQEKCSRCLGKHQNLSCLYYRQSEEK